MKVKMENHLEERNTSEEKQAIMHIKNMEIKIKRLFISFPEKKI